MSTPAVNQTETDGALSVLPEQGTKALCVIGTSPIGSSYTPSAYGGTAVNALLAAFGKSAATQFAARYMRVYGKPVIFVRTGKTVAGSYLNAVSPVAGSIGAITKVGAGSCTFANTTSDPLVGAAWQVVFLVGGTRGTTGIVYQVFKNGVAQYVIGLGTSTTFTITATQITIDVSAGTITAGDYITFTTVAPVAASAGTLADSGGGSSVVTLAAIVADTTEPTDDYQPWLRVKTGWTVGVAGGEVEWSLDGGRTVEQATSIGTLAYFIFPNSGGIRINFAAGTVTAGRIISFDAVAPCWNNTELQSAVLAAKATEIQWEIAAIIGPQTGSSFDLLESLFPDKKHMYFAHTRMPVGSESYPTYVASLAGVFGSRSSKYSSLCSGDCECSSPVDGRAYRRPSMFPLCAANANVSPEVDIADTNLGALPGTTIRDERGNPKYYDESYHGGLDDLRFHVLRTWDPEIAKGVYSNRPRIFSSPGSDFRLVPHRRVINIVHVAAKVYLAKRLNKDIFVDRKTGYILPAERKGIEKGLLSAIIAAAGKFCSGFATTVSKTDALLQNAPLTGSYRAIPKAYPEFADFEGGFENPATNVRAE